MPRYRSRNHEIDAQWRALESAEFCFLHRKPAPIV